MTARRRKPPKDYTSHTTRVSHDRLGSLGGRVSGDRARGRRGRDGHARGSRARGIRDRKHRVHTQQRQSEPETPKVGFMSHPPAFRLMIYERILESDEEILLVPHPRSKSPLINPTCLSSKLKENPPTLKAINCQGIHTDILCCNRDIRREAGYVLYRRNIFTVLYSCKTAYDRESPYGVWLRLLEWLGMIGPHNRSHLTDLRVSQEQQYADIRIRQYLRKAAVLLGTDSQWRRTLTVELQEGVLMDVTKGPPPPSAMCRALFFSIPACR